jgi:hypothetical protein
MTNVERELYDAETKLGKLKKAAGSAVGFQREQITYSIESWSGKVLLLRRAIMEAKK